MTKAEIFFVGDAVPEFVESQHPRDNDGKFTTGSGGGGAAKGPMSSLKPVNNNLAKAAMESGFKLGPQHEGLPAFIHPSGLKVVVHPVEGQKSSSKWALHHGETKHEGKGGDKLAALLKKISYSMVEKEHQSTSELSFAEKAKSLKDHGFTFVNELESGSQNFVNPNANVGLNINPFGNGWVVWKPGAKEQTLQSGFGHKEMLDKITEMSGPTDVEKIISAENLKDKGHPEAPAEAPKGTESLNNTAANVESTLQSKGYEVTETDYDFDTVIFAKENGAKVQYNHQTDKWIAITPGHMTKEGVGLKNLNDLLSGGAAVFAGGGPQPWTNSSKTITTKAEKAKQQAAAVEAHAAQEKKKAEYAKQNEWSEKQKALYKRLSEHKPPATPEEHHVLENYTGSSYTSWNETLRKHEKPTPSMEAAKSWLKKAAIPEDCVLYRGVPSPASNYFKSILDEGAVFFEKGFMSTSTDIEFAKKWGGQNYGGILFKINVPKGAKGASLHGISNHTPEYEILFHPHVKCTVKSYDPKQGIAEIDIDTSHIK